MGPPSDPSQCPLPAHRGPTDRAAVCLAHAVLPRPLEAVLPEGRAKGVGGLPMCLASPATTQVLARASGQRQKQVSLTGPAGWLSSAQIVGGRRVKLFPCCRHRD